MPPTLGGGDKCPRCDKTVYFAEERRALGRKYHSACLKCMGCNKMLDSTNCNDHDGEIYCSPCYRKNFAPSGVTALNQVQAGNVGGGGLGVGEVCPRCDRAVYMAEKVIGAGKSYHKACFRCGSCSKALDSTTLCQHEEDIFCKACYGRLYGPKGYGYAGGAAGLSVDNGKADEICRQNVSHYTQAQVASVMINGGESGSNEVCARCGGAVYFAERAAGMGKVYHKMCFKCNSCNKNLDSTLLTEHEDNIYCKACYGKNFGPKGFGYGTALVHSQ